MVRAHEWDVSRRLARSSRRPWWVAHPAAPPTLRIESESAGSRVVVAVTGDVDALTAPQLEAWVAECPLTGCTLLEIDMAGVRSLGSVGLTVLIGVRRWCLQRGIELRLRGAHPSVWRVFEATGLDRLFTTAAGPADHAPKQQLVLF
jgi:anti-anti-sigma factor